MHKQLLNDSNKRFDEGNTKAQLAAASMLRQAEERVQTAATGHQQQTAQAELQAAQHAVKHPHRFEGLVVTLGPDNQVGAFLHQCFLLVQSLWASIPACCLLDAGTLRVHWSVQRG